MLVISEHAPGLRLTLSARPAPNRGLVRWALLTVWGGGLAAAALASGSPVWTWALWVQLALALLGFLAAAVSREPVSRTFDLNGLEVVDRMSLLPTVQRSGRRPIEACDALAVDGEWLRVGAEDPAEIHLDAAGLETAEDRARFARWVADVWRMDDDFRRRERYPRQRETLAGGWETHGSPVTVEPKSGPFVHVEPLRRPLVGGTLAALGCVAAVGAELRVGLSDPLAAALYAPCWPAMLYLAWICWKSAFGPARRTVRVDGALSVDGTVLAGGVAVLERAGVAYLAGPPEHPALGTGIGPDVAGRLGLPLRRIC